MRPGASVDIKPVGVPPRPQLEEEELEEEELEEEELDEERARKDRKDFFLSGDENSGREREAAVFEGNPRDYRLRHCFRGGSGLGRSSTLMHRLLFPLLSLYFSPVTHTMSVDASSAPARI